jgi:hypothetical protein
MPTCIRTTCSNTKKLCSLRTQRVYVFHMILTPNTDYFHKEFGLYNDSRLLSVRYELNFYTECRLHHYTNG